MQLYTASAIEADRDRLIATSDRPAPNPIPPAADCLLLKRLCHCCQLVRQAQESYINKPDSTRGDIAVSELGNRTGSMWATEDLSHQVPVVVSPPRYHATGRKVCPLRRPAITVEHSPRKPRHLMVVVFVLCGSERCVCVFVCGPLCRPQPQLPSIARGNSPRQRSDGQFLSSRGFEARGERTSSGTPMWHQDSACCSMRSPRGVREPLERRQLSWASGHALFWPD